MKLVESPGRTSIWLDTEGAGIGLPVEPDRFESFFGETDYIIERETVRAPVRSVVGRAAMSASFTDAAVCAANTLGVTHARTVLQLIDWAPETETPPSRIGDAVYLGSFPYLRRALRDNIDAAWANAYEATAPRADGPEPTVMVVLDHSPDATTEGRQLAEKMYPGAAAYLWDSLPADLVERELSNGEWIVNSLGQPKYGLRILLRPMAPAGPPPAARDDALAKRLISAVSSVKDGSGIPAEQVLGFAVEGPDEPVLFAPTAATQCANALETGADAREIVRVLSEMSRFGVYGTRVEGLPFDGVHGLATGSVHITCVATYVLDVTERGAITAADP